MDQSQAEQSFAQMMERDEDQIDLAEAALLIAQTEYPGLDLHKELERLDQLASQISIDANAPALSHILTLNQFLFGTLRFAGNDEEYDDPENSYLNRVLDRRKGLPIALALVYTELARRLGLPIVGVGFPGHFMVKYIAPQEEILIDPYHQGVLPSQDDCRAILATHFGKSAELRHEYLNESTKKQILARMLNNLKGSYFRRQNYSKVHLMISLALAINPASLPDLRDRGMVYLAMHKYREAMQSFDAYLKLSPQGDPEAQEVLRALHRVRAQMN